MEEDGRWLLFKQTLSSSVFSLEGDTLLSGSSRSLWHMEAVPGNGAGGGHGIQLPLWKTPQSVRTSSITGGGEEGIPSLLCTGCVSTVMMLME